MPSFREVLAAVSDAWQHRRQELEGNAASVASHLAGISNREAGADLNIEWVSHAALAALAAEHDERRGGFGGAPKFPSPARLFFLLDHARQGDKARSMLERTLDGMAEAGDATAGRGFHRYSVDREWLVLHFEKMLYDNAFLARSLGQAGPRSAARSGSASRGRPPTTCCEMRGSEGALLVHRCDSDGHEGRFFTWTADQIRQTLPPGQAQLVIALLALGPEGNFEGDASVLRPARALREVAVELKIEPEAAVEMLATAREEMLAARARRVAPATDDKRLAGWNGMAVWSLAWLGAALPEPRYLDAARRAARFLLDRIQSDGRQSAPGATAPRQVPRRRGRRG
jgi:uncharacterized protein YyaL (SSP411 family)